MVLLGIVIDHYPGFSRGQMNHSYRKMISEVLSCVDTPLEPRQILARLPIDERERVRQETKQRVRHILWYEAQKDDGLYMRYDGGYVFRLQVEERLQKRVRQELQAHGLEISDGELKKPDLDSKDDIRQLHIGARREKYEASRKFLDAKEESLLTSFADGVEIDIEHLYPRLQVVETGTRASDLFRYATLLWSVPVSQGFGRRVRFLVWDEHTDKLIGLFALGDPVFNLSCRDEWIGWDHNDRAARLYNVMDIFTLGAVPPYSTLLCGKLVAMLATSNEVREIIYDRYKGKKTVIQKEKKCPSLALLTTGSALGKSSLYNRIKYQDRLLYQRIGESKGWGHFHLNNGLFGKLREYLQATVGDKEGGNRFGDGPNWKIRTARSALRHLGMPTDLLRHGIRREIYGIPLASNFDAFLRGETDVLDAYDIPFQGIADYWKERWLRERAERKPEYKKFNHSTISKRIHDAANLGD
jgi:hypothetical protein